MRCPDPERGPGGRPAPVRNGRPRSLRAAAACESEIGDPIFIEWGPNRTKIKKGTSLAPRRIIKRAVDESTRTVVSSDGWKLCLRDKDLNELYNLNDDPLETRNLYTDRQYTSVISRLDVAEAPLGNADHDGIRGKRDQICPSLRPSATITAVQYARRCC